MGTNPGMVAPVTSRVPDPNSYEDAGEKESAERALQYMGLEPNTPMQDITLDRVFIGSCTNSRIDDLRAAAEVARGKKVADSVYAMVVPGSAAIKKQAEDEGLDAIFTDAGFDWRVAGCSMCLGIEPGHHPAGRALRVHLQPQLRGTAGQGRPHAPSQPGDGGGSGDSGAFRGY